jgi:cytochrome c peroxidase
MNKPLQLLLLAISLMFVLPLSHSAQLATPDVDDIEYPDDEAPSELEVMLGKTLFFDPRLSINNQQSCASFHIPYLGFSDVMSLGVGTLGGKLGRNTPHIYNLAFASAMFWDGRMTTLEEQALGPIEAAGEMNMPLTQLIPRLKAVKYYRQTFDEVYGPNGLNKTNLGKAIAAFERTIISSDAPFDRYIGGDKNAMSAAQIRGLALFKGKANCIVCHDGANFTDDSFHNIGVGDDDPGRQAITGDPKMWGTFKTPGLRNIVFSAPYLHNGSAHSLEQVIELYNRGGHSNKNLDKLIKPLHLSRQEIFDLVAFMGALTSPVDVRRPTIP